MRYVAVYFDTNGVGRLVGGVNDFSSEAEAEARLQEIERAHQKPHKVEYRVIPYMPGLKNQTLLEHKIAT